MAIGKIYDSDEATRIQSYLNDINKPLEDVYKTKKELNKKIATGIYITIGIIGVIFTVKYVIKK